MPASFLRVLRAGAALTTAIALAACGGIGDDATTPTEAAAAPATTPPIRTEAPTTTVGQTPSTSSASTTTASTASAPETAATSPEPQADEPLTEDAVRNAVAEYYEIYNACELEPQTCDLEAAEARTADGIALFMQRRFQNPSDDWTPVPSIYTIERITIDPSTSEAVVEICEETEVVDGLYSVTALRALVLYHAENRWRVTSGEYDEEYTRESC